MRKLTDLTFATANTQDVIERGELTLEKGEKLMGIRVRIGFPIQNTSGGAVVLTDAQKRTLLAMFTLKKLDYGKGGKFAEPYVERTFEELRRHQLRCYRNELEGWSDSSTGLAKSLPNGATTTVYATLIIPTGKFAAFRGPFRNLWGMGRSQAASVRAVFERAAGTNQILAGVVLNGAVNFEIYDDSLPVKGDVWNPVPFLRKVDDQRLEFQLSEGLTLALDELSAVHASSLLTNFSLRMDDFYIHRQVSAQRTIETLLDADEYPSAALLTGEVTQIYEVAHGDIPFDQLPTGTPTFRQEGSRQLNTVSFMHTYVPIDSAEKLAEEVRNIAVEVRKKEITAVSLARVRGLDLGARLMPYVGMMLTDTDDKEFESYPGLHATPNAPSALAGPRIPSALLAEAQRMVAAHKSAGEDKAATSVIDELASSVPGAVTSGRGFSRGNTVLRNVIAQKHFR